MERKPEFEEEGKAVYGRALREEREGRDDIIIGVSKLKLKVACWEQL